MKRQARVIFALAALVLLAAVGLLVSALLRPKYLAELVSETGTVQRSAVGATAWGATHVPDHYVLGEAVRTGAASTARVRVGRAGGLQLAPNTVVRFGSTAGGSSVRVESGDAEMSADEEPVTLQLPQGALRLDRGTRIRTVTDDQGHVRVEVVVGRAVLERIGQIPIEALTGQLVMAHGASAGVVPITPPLPLTPPAGTTAAPTAGASASAPLAAADAGGPDAAAPAVEPSAAPAPTAGGPEEPADYTLAAGDSVWVHAPFAPIYARIRWSNRCPEGASLSVDGRAQEVTGRADKVLSLAPGSHRYALRCRVGGQTETRVSAAGSLVVLRDSGTAPLPSRPPRSTVDTDGRRYAVVYQNLLPELTVRWPAGADIGGSYVLTVRGQGGAVRTFPAQGTSVLLPSGRLAEGTHVLRFASGSQRSPETTVVIQFDNAARTAQLRTPAAGAVIGSTVWVSGSVLPGARVIAGGNTLSLDGQNRFGSNVPRGEVERSFAVMITHPSGATHVHLRRVQPGSS